MLTLLFFIRRVRLTRLLALNQVVDCVELAFRCEPAGALFRDLPRCGFGRTCLLPKRGAELLQESAAQSQCSHRGAPPLLGMQLFCIFVKIPLEVVQSLMTFVEPPHALSESLGLTPLHRPSELPHRLQAF